MNIILAAISGIGNIISGFFGFKKEQADVMGKAITALGDATASNSEREKAIATIISAEANNGGLSANWRPLLMLLFMGLLISFWFGFTPPNISGEMPPMISEIFDIIKIGIAGYIPARSIEKIIGQLNIASVLKKFIEKKVL